MTASLPDLSKLSLDEKLDMIDEIWGTIAQEQPIFPIPEWLKEELRRQHQEYLRNPDRAVSWDEAKARILNRYDRAKNST